MRIRTSVATASLLAVAGVSTACSSGTASTAPQAPEPAAGSQDFTAPERWPGLEVGLELDHRTLEPGAPGFAFQIQDAVLLTGTTGLPRGHLLGFDLDRRASDRLAAPVLTSGDQGPWVLTSNGLVPLVPGSRLPLAADWTLSLGTGRATVIGEDDVERATIEGALDELWISATGTVVGNLDGVSYDTEADSVMDVEPGCRLADRHTVEDGVFVCDDGTRLSGSVETEPDELVRYGWTTSGTEPSQVLTAFPHPELGMALRYLDSSGATPQATIDGRPLFFRTSGKAWVVVRRGLAEFDPLTSEIEVLRDMPGIRDAMIWLR